MEIHSDGTYPGWNKSDTCSNMYGINTTINWRFSERDALTMSFFVTTLLASVLSVCGSLTIIIAIFRIPELQTPSRKLLIFLSCSDLLLVIGNTSGVIWTLAFTNGDLNETKLYRYTAQEPACIAQAAVTSTASMASFFWTSFIALNCYLSIVHQNNRLTKQLKALPHILSWGVPLVVAAVTLLNNRYGLNVCTEIHWWCWITPKKSDPSQLYLILWQLLTGKAWEFSAYIFVCIMYWMVVKNVSAYVNRVQKHSVIEQATGSNKPLLQKRQHTQTYKDANTKLVFVPLVFLIARIPGSVRFILDLILTKQSKVAAAYLAPFQGLGDSAQGFLNCVVFVITTPILRERLRCRQTQAAQTPSAIRSHDHTSSSASSPTTVVDIYRRKIPSYGSTAITKGKGDDIRVTNSNVYFRPIKDEPDISDDVT